MENVLIGVTRGTSNASKVNATLIELNTSPLVLPGAPNRPTADPNMKFLMLCLLPSPQGQIPIIASGPTRDEAVKSFKERLKEAFQQLHVISMQQMDVELPGD